MTVAVIGLGLIGGSLLRALDRAGVAACGYDADPAVRREAAAGGFWVADSVAAARDADLVILAVPLPALDAVSAELAGYDGLVSDVISVKLPVLTALGGRRFVGGHPMAGRERSGFAAGDAALFEGCAWVLCLEQDTDVADWLRLATLVTGLGARAVPTSAAEHDAAVARISHVPHLLAASLAAAGGAPLPASLAAGSFRDGTRVAGSDPALMAAICGGNAGPVAAALDDVLADLTRARALLDGPDPIAALRDWFARGHEVRAAWPPSAGEHVVLPASRDALLGLGAAGGWVTSVQDGTVAAVLPVR